MQLISGIEATLSAVSVGLLLQMTEDHEAEIAIYRKWWAQHRVAGVFVVDLRAEDVRVSRAVSRGGREAASPRRAD
jgi:DNA-binding LacI/PurR family transcriptional regulator